MKRYSPKTIMKILEKEGWIEKRTRGSHHIFIKEGEKNIVVVSTSKRIIPVGTVKNIERQAEIKF